MILHINIKLWQVFSSDKLCLLSGTPNSMVSWLVHHPFFSRQAWPRHNCDSVMLMLSWTCRSFCHAGWTVPRWWFSNICYFSPLLGEMIRSDSYFLRWVENHQLGTVWGNMMDIWWYFPKQFTVGVLNATLDLAALVLVGVVGFLVSEVGLVSRCLRLSPFMWGGGCWLVWPYLEQTHSEIKNHRFSI